MTSRSRIEDPYELLRFVDAQLTVYPQVIEELSAGRKRSHWMWFVFPQLVGLGFSAMAQRFAIGSRAEAEAYLAHEILGPRLIECTRLIMAASDKSINDILGSPDDIKLRSSLTLFDAVSGDSVFRSALDKFCAGASDSATLAILEKPLEGPRT